MLDGAGERVFARAGFNGATMAAIADEPGSGLLHTARPKMSAPTSVSDR